MTIYRIEIMLKDELDDPEGLKALQAFHEFGFFGVKKVRTIGSYCVKSGLIKSTAQMHGLAEDLFVDPVLHRFEVDAHLADGIDFDWYVEIGFKAGVTDNAARVAHENLELNLGAAFDDHDRVASSKGFLIFGSIEKKELEEVCRRFLMNELIQRRVLISKSEWSKKKGELAFLPEPKGDLNIQVETMDCSSTDSVLALSRQRTLALSTEEAQCIVDWFSNPKRQTERAQAGLPTQATDVELEAIAQTWSEHCKHKIFNAEIEYHDEKGNVENLKSLYKTYIQGSTNEIRKRLGENDWCLSVFKDNAGVIRFDDDYSVAFKVETHNSPSALDPYGGALTGIVGVNRDAFGTGMGAELVANTDVFCFGPPDYDRPLPGRLFHPKRVLEGVRQGVEHGGNHSGVPTVNGAILFDECYVGKPLVFCGTLSVMPAKHEDQPGEDKKANPGDLAVMIGGRIGKDGIHGATFSSVALDDASPVSAVQIGDPITQKRMFDFLWEAKKENLYSCLTDNGAGGLSSSVGEMAEFSGGCRIFLDQAPLKYEGLQPWEILISEAQERMTASVPPEKIERFLELSKLLQVESTVVGEFTDTGLFECEFKGNLVSRMEMDFLHKGLPPMRLKARWVPPRISTARPEPPLDLGETLKAVLARPDVCSKEKVIRQYDHEVKGGSVIKPLVGVMNDAPADAGVVRPVLESMRGLALSNGICPKFSPFDSYHMTACAIDEAVRNIVAVGGSLDQIAGLDNFCWPDPVQSDKTPDGEYKLAQLVRSCKAIYDYCLGFGVPCISGKDSMKNDADLEGKKISIKPTLLFSAVGVIPDVRRCITSDFKQPGDLIYLLGETKEELAGSEYYRLLGIDAGEVPKVDLLTAKKRYETLSGAIQEGLVRSCHDCSDGGLGAALAEMAIGGRMGMELDLSQVLASTGLPEDLFLFSESQSRLVACVADKDRQEFERRFEGQSCQLLGRVVSDKKVRWTRNQELLLDQELEVLIEAWQKTLG